MWQRRLCVACAESTPKGISDVGFWIADLGTPLGLQLIPEIRNAIRNPTSEIPCREHLKMAAFSSTRVGRFQI
jgi:hypothetical protein